MICMAEGGKKKGLPDRTSNAADRQGSLFFNLPCIRCKFSNVVQSKSIAKDIQYHVQCVGGNGLVVFKPLYLRPADTVLSIKAVLADAVFLQGLKKFVEFNHNVRYFLSVCA